MEFRSSSLSLSLFFLTLLSSPISFSQGSLLPYLFFFLLSPSLDLPASFSARILLQLQISARSDFKRLSPLPLFLPLFKHRPSPFSLSQRMPCVLWRAKSPWCFGFSANYPLLSWQSIILLSWWLCRATMASWRPLSSTYRRSFAAVRTKFCTRWGEPPIRMMFALCCSECESGEEVGHFLEVRKRSRAQLQILLKQLV